MRHNDQMELQLAAAPVRSASGKRSRMARSAFWFEQMQKAVDAAIDWKEMAQAGMKKVEGRS